MNKQNSNGIYTYIGVLDEQGSFKKGTLTYPSGKKVEAEFQNNQLQIKAELANKDNKLGKVIDCSLLDQEQFDNNIESLKSLLEAMQLQKGETLAIKHHQLKLNEKTANQIATLLQKNGITTLQWVACGGG